MSLGSIRELSAGPEPGGVSTFTNRRGGKDRKPSGGEGGGGEDGKIKKGLCMHLQLRHEANTH